MKFWLSFKVLCQKKKTELLKNIGLFNMFNLDLPLAYNILQESYLVSKIQIENLFPDTLSFTINFHATSITKVWELQFLNS